MNRFFLLFSFFILIGFAKAYAQADSKKKAQPVQQTSAQLMIASTGEDSLNGFGEDKARTVISGYGEINVQKDKNAKTTTANVKRAVLFIGHQYTGRIAFFSEIEIEDAKVEGGGSQGEISLEQAYLKFSLNPRQYFLAGLILPRIGITNENHLPINYNGVERTQVEQLIIPTTWREIGIGFYGQSSALPLTYMAAIVNGLNAEKIQHGTGFREARGEGQNALFNSIGINAALQYFAGNWKFQLSGYTAGTAPLRPGAADTLGLESGLLGSPLYMGEANVQYSNNGIALKALGTMASLPNADKINVAYSNNPAKKMWGAYAELAYNLFEHAKASKWQTKQLNLFARYEALDLNASVSGTGLEDGILKQTHLITGINYMPIPHLSLKADCRLMNTGNQNMALVLNPNPNAMPYKPSNALINVGIGYAF